MSGSGSTKSINQLLTDAFRKDANKIMAILIKLYGPANMMWAEDTLQDTFAKAMQHWKSNGLPENPSAWLILTAKRNALDKLRNIKLHQEYQKHQNTLAPELTSEWTLKASVDRHFEQSNGSDEELRLLFWVAATDMPEHFQLPLMLKTLCGLRSEAISRALLENNEAIKKRLQRGCAQLSQLPFELPSETNITKSLEKVHLALYLLFNEGISPRNPDPEKHIDLCVEAIGLTRLLIESEVLKNQETLALFALMHYHYARLPARKKGEVLSIPLDKQDRQKWNSRYIVKAARLLSAALAAKSSDKPRFLLEALIAHEHCRAKSFEATDWQTIIQHYNALFELNGSPIVAINRAVALAHAGSIDEAISQVKVLTTDKKMARGYQVSATLSYLFVLKGDVLNASICLDRSIEQGLTEIETRLLCRRISELIDNTTSPNMIGKRLIKQKSAVNKP